MSDLSDIRVNLVETWDEAQAFMSWLGERRPVMAFDLETEGVDWWRHKIRTAQFGDAMTGWTIPYGRWSGLVEHVVKNYEGEYVAHNGQFDYKFMELDGLQMPYERCHDTYIMAHLQDPRRHGGLGLKNLADKHIHHAASHGEKMLKKHFKESGTDWDTVEIDTAAYWAYGALDTIFTARLYEKMRPAMDTMPDLYALERRVGIILMRMCMKGMRLDMEYVRNQTKQIQAERAEIEMKVLSEYGVDKIGSAMKVAEVLMADGWVPRVKTATGKPSLKEEVLVTVDHPLAEMKVRHGKLTKLVSNYLSTFEELATPEDRIHCEIKQLGAATGRMSIAKPSLQNLPAPREGDEDSVRIRNAIIADEGETLCAVDYSSIELRLAADHSNSVGLIQAYADGEDMHQWMASLMFSKPQEEVTKTERSTSKAITFGKLFGAGVKKISQQLGIPIREGAAFIEAYNQAFPELQTYMAHLAGEGERLAKEHNTQPYVYTEFGRYQPTPHRTEYRLTNYRTQGTAADLLKMAIVDLDAAGFGPHMLIPVHDEIVASFPSHEAEEMMHEMERIMAYPDRRVPLPVEGSLGQRFGECK